MSFDQHISSTSKAARSVMVAVILFAVSYFLHVGNYAAMTTWTASYSYTMLGIVASINGLPTNETSMPSHPPEQQEQRYAQRGRRLQSRKPNIDEETQQKQMKSYLGGLYPPVDKDLLPLYLRDTIDETSVQVLDMYNPSGQAVTRNRDLVFFWHIPKASGSTMKNIMNFCFNLKRAEKVNEKPSMEFARENILNMDTSSPDGLSFSFANQIVNSNRVDVIVSNYFLSGSALFTDMHLGKTFTILRHPVDTALSLFHYRRKASWERSFREDWMQLSFHEYVSSDDYMDSWIVRQLTGTMPWVALDESHLERAKLMMKRKIFVGILEQMDETLRQLRAHFGWEEKTPFCAYNYLHSTPANKNDHPQLQGGRGGVTWQVVVEKEKWDLSLYHFGLELFAEQRERYPPQQ